SFIILYHFGIHPSSTFLWLPTHAIEKYLKAFLLSCDGYNSTKLRKKFGHNIKKLWCQYKKEFGFNEHDLFNEYIDEISAISTYVRYGEYTTLFNDNLLSGFIFFIAHFNKFANESKNYSSTYYGLKEIDFSAGNLITLEDSKNIIKKYMHLVIEHSVTISPTGSCHKHEYLDGHENHLRQNRFEKECPFCNGTAELNSIDKGITNSHTCESIKSYFSA
ncbi:MAG: hypothetical protein D3910_03295, partial [Candidatus Electrothrix sp. ATG2]|nr:hypothetical protein [Candidatus Electrothrix sp. ATG2]